MEDALREAGALIRRGVGGEAAIVEQGTHQELLRRGGFYHDLYNSQFAEALEEAC